MNEYGRRKSSNIQFATLFHCRFTCNSVATSIPTHVHFALLRKAIDLGKSTALPDMPAFCPFSGKESPSSWRAFTGREPFSPCRRRTRQPPTPPKASSSRTSNNCTRPIRHSASTPRRRVQQFAQRRTTMPRSIREGHFARSSALWQAYTVRLRALQAERQAHFSQNTPWTGGQFNPHKHWVFLSTCPRHVLLDRLR